MKNSDLGAKMKFTTRFTRYVYSMHLVQFEILGRLCMKFDVLGLIISQDLNIGLHTLKI